MKYLFSFCLFIGCALMSWSFDSTFHGFISGLGVGFLVFCVIYLCAWILDYLKPESEKYLEVDNS